MRIAKGGQRPRHTGLLDTVLVQRVENYAKVFAYISPIEHRLHFIGRGVH